jgi:NAD(P)-dependent dehydrogenase (short-subunit alcohol dehydrogenase family)
MGRFDGKVAIVTGAGRFKGLGEAMARRLASEGASIVLTDKGSLDGDQFPAHGIGTSDEMEQVAASIRHETGAQVRTQACDVRFEDQVEAMVANTVTAFGRVDVLVNNAGIGYLMTLIVDTPSDDWDAVLGVNLKGMFLCTKHVARHLIVQGNGGRIVNIGSQASKSGFANASAYTSSKHGVVGFTRAAALELAQHGITVNAICPNHVTTGLGAWQNSHFSALGGTSVDEYLDAMKARIPIGRTGTPNDIAAACAFLCSDDAAYITGEAMNVSGGEEYH